MTLCCRITPILPKATSPATTGPAAVGSAEAFETLVEELLDAATQEIQARRIADELASASRQLNHLERNVRPAVAARVAEIQRVLEEREREETTRLRLLHRRTKVEG